MAAPREPAIRTCLVTREERPQDEMIRFVLGPEAKVYPDLKRKLPGRGVWITAEQRHVEQAVRKKLFSRGFGEAATADPDLADLVDRLLVDAGLGALGMARKAGEVITGFAKVESSIRQGAIGGLIHAAEAAEDGRNKLQALLRHAPVGGRTIPVVRSFTGTQLDLALGGENVIHAATLAGRAGDNFLGRHAALLRYRGLLPDPEPTDGSTSGSDPRGL